MEALQPIDTTLPLYQFLDEALDASNEFIAGTERKGDDSKGIWLTPLFPFGRLAKSHPDLAGLKGKPALSAIKKWQKAHGVKTTDFGRVVNDDDFTDEFLSVWDEIRCPAGSSPLEAAVARAQRNPVTLPDEWERSAKYALFVSAAVCLQEANPGCSIFLPCRELGELLGVSHTRIAQYRKWAVQDGLLTITREHNYGTREATEFRVNYRRDTPKSVV